MKRLQYEMVRNRFTVKSLSEKINISRYSIYRWLNGTTTISLDSMVKLHSLGFDIKSLEKPTEEID